MGRGSSGDEVVQLSAIKCLRACTVSTSLLVEIAHSSDEGYILLQSTWRRVWSLVFRPDLIYCACTKGATLNSVGDFVLQLLTDMIQRSCTDIGFKADEIMTTRRSNFVYSHQSDLWNLPVFARSSGIIAPYSIIYAVLSTTGLSEKGCLSAESIPILSSLKGATASLRSQLVNYCLLGLDLPYSHVVAVASACIGALLHGRASLLSEIVNFNIEGGWEGPDESICEGIHVDPLHLLWQLPSLHLPAYGLGGWNLNDDTHKRVSVEIRRLLSKRDSNASFNDLVSTDETRQLVELFWSHLEKRNQNEMSPEIGETPFDVFSRSIRLIKVALSVMLESPPSFAQAESVALSSHLTSLFCGVVAEIKLVCGDENAFVSIFGGICGVVRIMTRLASHCSVEWSNTVLEAASMLCDTCYALLDNMVSRDRDYDSASSQRVTTGDDIFNGFDDDHAIEQDRPMPLFRDSSKPPRKKQRRHNDTSTSFSCTIVDCPPNQSCCYFAASLLLALSPEPDANKLVGCTLAGIDRNDSESYADVDIYGGALASILLSSRESLLISSAMLNEHGSVDSSLISLETVNLICRIISAVRSAATPDSCLHMFGYEIYPRIVMICEDIFQGHHLDSISSQHLIDLIKAPVNKIERRSLVLRPVMRAAQLRSAILVFQSGKKQFHEQFDREFARSLVLPALSDISSLVRWYALIAVVSAVKMLPEEKVAQSVLRRLPSLVASLKDERMSYQEWFSEKLSVVSSGSTMLEKQAWDDIFCSIRYDTISCWAKIAQAATSRRIREQCVLHFIHLSNLRPDSEGLSFRGLQRIALFYGITMRALSEYYLGSIVSHSLINSESHLPLLLTTPGVVQRLLEFGHIGRSKFNYSEGAVAKIRETCRAKFISLNLPLFAPRILFYCTEAIFPSPDLANWKKTVSSDNVLTELFAALGEQCCVRGLTNVITENISEIQAHLAWRRTGSEKDNAVAVVAEKLVFEVLSQEEVQRHFAKLSWTRTVRVVIELSCTDGDDSSAERLLEAFHSLSAMYDKRSNGGAECRSLIDAIIHSRLMLVRCHQWGCRRTAWLPMDASLSLIITKLSDGSECASEISLFVLGVSHILFEVELKEYHLASVTALDKLGKSLVSYETGGFNVKNCMRTIVGLVSIVLKRNHAAHQDACRDMIINSKQVSRNIQGLTGAYRMSERLYFDGEPWPQRERRGPLDDILDHKTSMEEQIIDACSSLLEDISEKQRLSQIHQSANSCNEGGIHEILDRLEEICWRSSLRSEFNARLSAMDEHRVLDLLQHLNESVCHKGSIESPSAHHLVRVLMRLCTESFSRAIRAESSRCLGNLVDCEIEVETGSTHAEPKDSLRNAIEEGNVIHHLRSRCIVSLLDAVKSHHPWIASVAVDTLKVIVSKKITFDWNSLASSSDQKLLKLLDFTCSVNEGEQQTCRLTEREIAFMRSQSSSHDKDDWCWNATDWSNRSQSGKTFDEWICFIVPSIILSCYKSRPNQLELKSSMIFFQACERMSCINPNFAATLFPCLILDLLQRSSLAYDENVTAEDLLLDTWIGDPDSDENKNLSRCMASLLTDSLSTKSAADLDLRKTVKLTIHSIDILRQLTEHRFRTSPGHRRNNDIPMCLKRHLGGERRRPEQYLLTPDAVRDIELASTQQWDGLKYGTVLELDGLIIAKACVKACKSTAALLYAEMYAENRFGGSTAARDTIESLVYPDQLSSCPRSAAISGFWVRNRKSCLTYRESRDFLATLYMCFRLIEESDAQEAVRQELADLSVLLPENPELTDDRATKESRSHDRDGGVESSAQVLDGVCFSSALGSYVAYLASYDTEANYPSIRRLSGSELADSTVWNRSAAVAQDLCNPEDLRLRHHLCPADIEDLQSFQLYMTEAVVNLLDKNYLACGAHAKEARSVLLDTISLHLSSGTSSEAILIILDCFRSINFLESFLDQSSSLANLCRLFQPKTGDPTCGKHWGRSELSSCIKEVIARHLVTQVSNDCPKAQKLLLDIMWDTHSMYSSKGDLRSAGATLSRISTLVLDHSMKLGQVGESDCITRLSIEEARLLESRGNFTGAIRSLKQIIKRLRCMSIGKSQIDDNRIADVLLLCGNWMAGRKSEPAASILNSYLKPGAEIAQNLFRKDKSKINAVRLANALLSVSQVAFSIYDSVASRVKSFEWQNASKLLEERKRETEECTCLIQGMQAQRNTDKKRAGKLLAKEYEDLCIYRARLAKEIEQTEMERSKILASYRVNQSLVLESIADALSLTNTGGDAGMTKHVYRFVGVWFSALERNEYDRPVDAIICQTIEKVPSFHFVTLSSQIFSRVESVSLTLETAFQHTLHRLVNKLCFDHPYHCLVHLVNLLNGTNVGSGVNGRNASAFVENAGDARVKAGTEIATALKKHSGSYVSHLVANYQKLAHAYIHLAMTPTEPLLRGDTKRISFVSVVPKTEDRLDACLGGRRSLNADFNPCVLTCKPPIRPACDYGEGLDDPIGAERVLSFESFFALTDGGVHRPKIVVCIGSRGGKFRQLVKGEDEIRQDAVMQQVFGFVNEFLLQRVKTDQRKSEAQLGLYTYSIIPLSPASGVSCLIPVGWSLMKSNRTYLLFCRPQVLEWVEHAVPFGDFIIDKGSQRSGLSVGSHSRYYPGEWGNNVCRELLKSAQNVNKRVVFDAICLHFSPSFRFFFMERFGYSADRWYAAKMRYTRSVAVNSVVGHILGIGDRHCSNILVHQETGEVVHIDFGIVFEQGRVRGSKYVKSPEVY